MLMLGRKAGQAVMIDLIDGLDPRTPVRELFVMGPIEIVVTQTRGPQVKLGIRADARLLILRQELYVRHFALAMSGSDAS